MDRNAFSKLVEIVALVTGLGLLWQRSWTTYLRPMLSDTEQKSAMGALHDWPLHVDDW